VEEEGFEPSVPVKSGSVVDTIIRLTAPAHFAVGAEDRDERHLGTRCFAHVAAMQSCEEFPKLEAVPGDFMGRQAASSRVHSAIWIQPSRIRYWASSADISTVPSGLMAR
jgi:hypothetical protein